MPGKFKFNILTGENAAEKYAAIPVKDPFTFYLLETGAGYLGEKKLFDQTVGTVDTINSDNPGDNIPTEAAIVEFVNQVVENRIPYEIDGVPGTSTPGGSSLTQQDSTVLNVYSTEETRIGTWVNGEPLYRRVIVCKTNSMTDAGTSIARIEPGLDVKSISGTFAWSTDNQAKSSVESCGPGRGNVGLFTWYTKTTGDISMYVNYSEYCNRDAEIILEYTKPTN